MVRQEEYGENRNLICTSQLSSVPFTTPAREKKVIKKKLFEIIFVPLWVTCNKASKEEQVYRAEQEERYRLGLHGADAIRHYNEWMKRYDMEHLMIKEE